jgi:hypothetical protein
VAGEVDRCRGGKWCKGRNADGPAETPAPLCAACCSDIQRCLSELPPLIQALHSFLAHTPKSALQSKVSRTPEPACPIDPRVDALETEAYDVVDRAGGWNTNVQELMRLPEARFLVWRGEHRELVFLDGAKRALDIRRIHSRISAVVGLERRFVKRHAPCPECHLPMLGSWVGEEVVRCTAEDCGFVGSLAEYDLYCAELIKEKR